MANKTKNWLAFASILSLSLIFLAMAIFMMAPRKIKHLGYQIFPGCWSCLKMNWDIDSEHAVSLQYPDNWVVQNTDDYLVIQPTKFIDSDMKVMISPIDLVANNESGISNQLEAQLSVIFANFQEHDVTEPAYDTDMNGKLVAKTWVRAIPYISVDDVLQDFLDEPDINPLYVEEYELILADYGGRDLLITAVWRSGTPKLNPWGYDQMQMILNSIQFE